MEYILASASPRRKELLAMLEVPFSIEPAKGEEHLPDDLPVTQAAEKAEKQLLNSTIDKFNSLLLTIANDSNVYFVDTNTALKNNDSRLDKDKAEEDGIHLNAEGERILLDYVLCHVPE